MKISVTDTGSGIMQQFANAIGATAKGRFILIPENKGSGYITGFTWGNDLRMLIRHYQLSDTIVVERTNTFTDEQQNIVFLFSGIFPSLMRDSAQAVAEQASILICRQAVSSVIAMPSQTLFGSVTIAVSTKYLRQLFGHIDHPVVGSVLEADDRFVLEAEISPAIVEVAGQMLGQPVPESIERRFYQLKCEELLCHTFALLSKREAVAMSRMHIDDIKAIYAVKAYLQTHLDEPPGIAGLAKEARMSEPKLRKLFRQTFGKGIFEYFQSLRMQEAARLLKEDRLSVSEAGYRLGFSNLSHFTRVFEEHTGMKPKQYSVSGG